MVKHLPTMRETLVQSLGGEDGLEKEMATHSSILAWDNNSGGRSLRLEFTVLMTCSGTGNGLPLLMQKADEHSEDA